MTIAFQQNAFQNSAFQISLPPIIIDPGHDGDREKRHRKKLIAEERARNQRRRAGVVDAFETIVEGKRPPVDEPIEPDAFVMEAQAADPGLRISTEQFLHHMHRLDDMWKAYVEADDEDVLRFLS